MTSPEPTIIPAGWRVVVRQTYLGQSIANVMGVRFQPGTLDVAAAQLVANRVGSAWAGAIRAMQNPGVQVVDCVAYSLQNPLLAAVYPINLPGTYETASSQPNNRMTSAVCANVGLLTGLRGRRYRGRTGLAGLPESQVDGNTLTAAYRTAIETAFNTFRLDVAEDSGLPNETTLAVISERAGTATPVTAVSVAATVGTRVSRLR